jgi:hypothetical protein
VFGGVLVVYLLTATYAIGEVPINDTFFTAFPAFTLGQFGTLNINPAINYTDKGWAFILDGNLRSDRFPGPILLATPFYAVFGGDRFSLGPSAVVAALTTAGSVAFLHRSLLRLVTPRTATATALAFAFGTAAWTVSADGLWTHGPTLLGLSFAMWAVGSERYAVAGAGYVLAIMSRPHTAAIAAVQGVWASVTTRSWRPAVKMGLVSALGLAGLVFYNRINAGSWDIFPGTYGGRFDAAVSTGSGGQATVGVWGGDLAATFGSPARGLLVLSPFLVMAVPGLRTAWQAAPSWVRSSAVGALVYLVIQLAGNTWIGATGIFGNRLVLEPLLLSMPLLAAAWASWAPERRWALAITAAFAAAAVWWHAVASVVPAVDLGALDPAPRWSDWAVAQAITAAGPVIALLGALFVAGAGFAISRVRGGWGGESQAARPVPVSRRTGKRAESSGADPEAVKGSSVSNPRVKGSKKRR